MVKKGKKRIDEEEILRDRLSALEGFHEDFSEKEIKEEPKEKIELKSDKEIKEVPEDEEIFKELPELPKDIDEDFGKPAIKKIILDKIKRKPDIEGKEAKKPNAAEVKKISENIKKIKKEMAKIVMGQEKIVNSLIMGLLCNAHVLVEGVPGIAKTLAIRALAAASGCTVKRIQFTVDMLPTDIIGITNYTPEKGFEIIKGPIFANFLIADEINRAPPKTQSALIEGMQEKQVTIGRKKFHLPEPFFVMATENPIENAGVYPLPEAQIDRFLFKVIMGYPKRDVEKQVMETNMTLNKFEDFKLKAVINPKEILKMQEVVKKVYLDDSIKNYILAIVRKTRQKDFPNAEFISYGSSPRASIGLFIASKANALMEGRNYVLPEDVKEVVYDILRHRLLLSYKATIQKISPDLIIKEILESVKVE
jgi:MoxR-like ATPase